MVFSQVRAVIGTASLLVIVGCASGTSTSQAPTTVPQGVAKPQSVGTVSGPAGGQKACASSFTVPLVNHAPIAKTIDVDGFAKHLPCTLSGALYGVTFYPVNPLPNPLVPIKLGNFTVSGTAIVFTPQVATITLPPNSQSAISVAAETSTSEVAIPLVPGAPAVLTANAPTLASSLTVTYASTGGGGSLYSSACAPAIVGGVLAQALSQAIIEGIPSFYCALGTVDSATVLFGAPTVTFKIGAPIPDRSFITLDGPTSEYACDTAATPTCVTPEFTVPTITNVIAGNVQELQSCVPARNNTNCNSDANPSPAPAATSLPAHGEVQLLIADDPTFVAPATSPCSSPTICGGFIVDTSAGTCLINNAADLNGDIPPGTPKYKDPGGPQESPPASGGTSRHTLFPAAGPYAEIDLVSGASGTTCAVTVTEADGPLQRSVALTLPVR